MVDLGRFFDGVAEAVANQLAVLVCAHTLRTARASAMLCGKSLFRLAALVLKVKEGQSRVLF